MPKTKDKHTDIIWARVNSILMLLLENDDYLQLKRNKELTETVMKQFGISERSAQIYISEAKREFRKIGRKKAEKGIEQAYRKAIRDREFLFRSAKSKKDYNLALKIAQDRDKIQGLYVEQVEHTGSVENRIVFVEDLKE